MDNTGCHQLNRVLNAQNNVAKSEQQSADAIRRYKPDTSGIRIQPYPSVRKSGDSKNSRNDSMSRSIPTLGRSGIM
jgi:hypothetical protein